MPVRNWVGGGLVQRAQRLPAVPERPCCRDGCLARPNRELPAAGRLTLGTNPATRLHSWTITVAFLPGIPRMNGLYARRLGRTRMADTSRGLSYQRLVNVAQWHVRDDNYAAARAAIVNAHHKHPMAAIGVWASPTIARTPRPAWGGPGGLPGRIELGQDRGREGHRGTDGVRHHGAGRPESASRIGPITCRCSATSPATSSVASTSDPSSMPIGAGRRTYRSLIASSTAARTRTTATMSIETIVLPSRRRRRGAPVATAIRYSRTCRQAAARARFRAPARSAGHLPRESH